MLSGGKKYLCLSVFERKRGCSKNILHNRAGQAYGGYSRGIYLASRDKVFSRAFLLFRHTSQEGVVTPPSIDEEGQSFFLAHVRLDKVGATLF